MKRLTLLVLILLCGLGKGSAQQAAWKPIYSEKFHFIASFPGEPEQTKVEQDTVFGPATITKWALVVPTASYEISVADFADLQVKMESEELASFYKKACIDMGGNSASCRNANNEQLFDELGTSDGFTLPGGRVEFIMFLVRQRLYVAKVETHGRIEKRTGNDIAKFLDSFRFTSIDEKEKKLKWGLPKGEGQDRKK